MGLTTNRYSCISYRMVWKVSKTLRVSSSVVIITPMTLTREEVDHIALLARLDLSEDEKTRFQQQLSAILDHVAQLQQLDTRHIPPTSGVQPEYARLRRDEPRDGLAIENSLQNAPKIENRQFRVPPVLE